MKEGAKTRKGKRIYKLRKMKWNRQEIEKIGI